MNRLILPLIGCLLCACSGRPLVVAATPTPVVPQYCPLRVEGRWVVDAGGNVVILHGASLPTLAEMAQSDRDAAQRLRELAAAGARVVRLPVDQSEITPTFVPAAVSPFIDQANALGMLVILAYRNDLDETVRKQGEAAEDWLRLALTYLRNAPGVWFEPFARPIATPKWRAMNQRMVDVARGFRADNVIVVNAPDWLRDAPNERLTGSNVAYAVPALDGWPLDAAPFILTDFDGADVGAVQAAQVWSIASEAVQPAGLLALWRTSKPCE
ncbi:MAG: cellulase family glycosylhydrolase [Anaerolineae bacterium]|nr:glycoside hydrolase family 5 protein [Candidatus Roseilinea sp.]MDW8448571.1 cellulase family glycosylhydrolase [Anaerolineae bacterium]